MPTPEFTPPPAASPAAPGRDFRPVALVAIVAALLLAYANSFSGVFVFDDRPTILENPTIRDLGNLGAVLSPSLDNTASGRPVANLTLAVNYAIGGLNPLGYHVGNLLIHLAATLALFGLVRRTFQLPRLSERFGAVATPIAAAIAVLWAVHPLQTESVTYIAQRVEALVGCFYLLTLYCFIRSVDSPLAIRWQLLAVGACLLGMGSKELMVSAPLFVLLLDRTLVSGTFRAAVAQRRWFYAALAATWVLLGAWVLGAENRAGTAGFGTASSWHYLLTQCHAIVHYLRLSLWPSPLIFDHGKSLITDPLAVLPQALLLVALFGATLWATVKRSPAALLGAWFFAILAPTSSIVPVATQTMAEHRMYLPLAAVVVLVVLAGHTLLGRYAKFGGIGLAVLCIGLTLQRNADYHSELRLWSTTAEHRPDNPRAHSMLGQSFFNIGQTAEAIAHYQTALRISPDHFEARNNLGIALVAAGRFAEAEPHFREAARLEPRYAQVYANLGMALHALGRSEDAIRQLETALRIRPDRADTHSNLCMVLNALGHSEAALQHGKEAVRLMPENAEAHNNLGMSLHTLGQPADARAHFEEALRLKPALFQARSNLAKVMLAQGQHEEAIAAYRAVLEAAPESASDHYALGNLYVKSRRWTEALPHCEAAVRLEPDHVESRTNYGTVLFFADRPTEAIAQFNKALELNPASYKAHYFLGNVMAAQSRNDEARTHYEHALRLNPEYAPAKQNLSRLAALTADSGGGQ